MKKITIIIGFIVISSIVSAQPWLTKLPQGKAVEELTLYDYQKAFNDYWAPFKVENGYYYVNGVKTKAVGWKQFQRWNWDMENQVDVETGRLPVKTAQEVVDEYNNIKPALSRSAQANWTNMGTNSSTGGYAGIGRLNCIAFHPTDLNTYWVGSPSGGLWVTHDNGSSWTCLTDNTEVIGVSDIVIPTDYATSHTIYIATGDRDHWDNRSVGVLKSTDDGVTWKTTGLTYTLASYTMVTRLLLDPTNNNTIIAATTRGVYKTTDGGTTWNTQLTPKSFIDMEYKPGDYNTLYGSNTSGGIYVSSNGGANWSQVVMISDGGRVELAVSPNQSTWVYAVVGSNINGLYGVYKSINSGAGYTKIFDGKQPGNNLLGWSSAGSDSTGQAWYDLAIDASPKNANIVLVGGVNTWRSNDGGSSWAIINHWWGDQVQAVHADKHALKYRSNGDLFECNDGGIYFSDNDGNDFTDITNGMVTSQMYKLGVSQTVAGDVITGLQDNGTKSLAGGVWDDVLGGDGMECMIDYSDENIQYGSIYYGDIHRTRDHWQNSTGIKPDSAGKGAWITPFIIDPVDHNTLYAGFKEVWKSSDQGDSWIKISNIKATENLLSMAISLTNNKVIVVAHGRKIWKTTNGGTGWNEITGNLPISSANITNVAINSANPNTIWVTMGGYITPAVFESTNGDTIWTDISAGLPQIPAYSVVQNIQDTFEVQLYVGTELGVYLKNGSDNWIAYNNGLPNVKIGELDVYYNKNMADSRLRAATYGRGLWETNLYFKYLPMAFNSLTTTQKNTASVAPADQNAEIACIKINTENTLSPFDVKSFSLTMDGTTDITDVSAIKIYYTGLNPVFAPSNLYATAMPASGSISLNGNQTLQSGNNYFWLAYDVKSTAGLGHFLDAQVLDVTLDSLRTPDVSDPAGARIISRKYCPPGTNDTMMEYISGVNFGNISTTSGWGDNGYQDFSGIVGELIRGIQDTITVNITSPVAADELLIWADWNQDGVFDNASEKVYSSGVSGSSLYTAVIYPPATADTGFSRLRIRLNNTSAATASSDPCAVSGFGEVEDYSIRLIHNVGIRKFTEFKDLAIYPNPATDQLTIDCKSISELIDVEIFNAMGQSVYKSRFSNKAVISLTDLSTGVYLIKLKAGESFLLKKFVKD